MKCKYCDASITIGANNMTCASCDLKGVTDVETYFNT